MNLRFKEPMSERLERLMDLACQSLQVGASLRLKIDCWTRAQEQACEDVHEAAFDYATTMVDGLTRMK